MPFILVNPDICFFGPNPSLFHTAAIHGCYFSYISNTMYFPKFYCC